MFSVYYKRLQKGKKLCVSQAWRVFALRYRDGKFRIQSSESQGGIIYILVMIEEKAFKNWIVAKPAFSNQMNMLYVYKIHIDTCIMPKKYI